MIKQTSKFSERRCTACRLSAQISNPSGKQRGSNVNHPQVSIDNRYTSHPCDSSAFCCMYLACFFFVSKSEDRCPKPLTIVEQEARFITHLLTRNTLPILSSCGGNMHPTERLFSGEHRLVHKTVQLTLCTRDSKTVVRRRETPKRGEYSRTTAAGATVGVKRQKERVAPPPTKPGIVPHL